MELHSVYKILTNNLGVKHQATRTLIPRASGLSVFNLDLKRAEVAIESGRLNDAFSLLQSSTRTKHAGGQQLIDRLIGAFVDRAKKLLAQDSLDAAQLDARHAQQLAGQQIEVIQLLNQIDQKRNSIVGHAREAASEALTDQLKLRIDSSDDAGVIRWIADNRLTANSRLDPLITEAATRLQQQAVADFETGRLDRCQENVDLLAKAGFCQQPLGELSDQLTRCRLAIQELKNSNFELALRQLKRAIQISPAATWLESAIAATSQCRDNAERVHSGPLGLFADMARPPVPSNNSIKQAGKRDIRSPRLANAPRQMKCDKSILQVDQLGSILLLRGDLISIGTPSVGKSADIVLQTDGLNAKILISRDGEDYFASSQHGFFVNNQMSDRHILSDGDTITVGTRGRLKFLRSVAASNSAVLMMQGGKLKRRDIRSIVLMDDSILFAKSGGHFPIADLPNRVIVRPTEKSGDEYLIHEQGSTEHRLLSADHSQSIANIRFALSPNAVPHLRQS